MTADEVTIRPAAAGDLEELLELYGQLNEVNIGLSDAPGAPQVLEAITAQPSRHLIVAEAGGRVLGTADLLVAANLTHGARPWALIENVVVERGARRSGIGALLIGRLVEIAREAGCYRIVLTSDKGREDAHAFYRRLGFGAVAEGFKLYFE